MITKKQMLVPIFSVVVAGATPFGAGTILVHAQTGNNPFSGLAAAIATKFNLNQTDVQTAITAYMQQQRGNWQQNWQQRETKRLDRLVSQGKITNQQETAIVNELTTLQNQYNPSSLKAMTQTQRQQAFQNEKNAITSWANSQTPPINPAYVIPFGMGHRGGFYRPRPTPTP